MKIMRKVLQVVLVVTMMFPASLVGLIPERVVAQSATPCIVTYTGNSTPSHRLLILLNGLNTSNTDGNGYSNWSSIKSGVSDLYDAVVHFSYDKDDAQGRYETVKTANGLEENHIPALKALIESCKARPDNFTSVDLMGHSQGGFTAFNFLKEFGLTGALAGYVKNLITLDSPVNGSSRLCTVNFPLETSCTVSDDTASTFMWALHQIFNPFNMASESGKDMGRRYFEQNIASNNVNFVENIRSQQGTQIWNITNRLDIAVPVPDATIAGHNSVGTWGDGIADLGGHSSVFNANYSKEVVSMMRPIIEETNSPSNPEIPETIAGSSARFIAHIENPNVSVVAPGQTFVKTWRVKNVGTTSWNNTYKLVFQYGNQLWVNKNVSITGTVAPNQEVDLSVKLTAPNNAGEYQGYWKMVNSSGQDFGDIVPLKIKVQVGADPIGIGTGVLKLFTGTNYSGTATSYGQGDTNSPNATAYSLQLPAGWSVRTYRGDGFSGTGTNTRCWADSVPNLQDHDNWQGAIQSMKVYNYNDCAGGKKVKLYSGTNYQNEILAVDNNTNAPSKNSYSIDIPTGWSVKAYTSDNFGGGVACWSSSIANLQDTGWHNAIDSMQLYTSNVCPNTSHEIKLCTQTGYAGCNSTKVESNFPSLSAAGYGNDNVQSIIVSGDWRAVLYHGENYEGARTLFTSGDNDLADTAVGNNQASSIQVRRVDPTRIIIYDLGDLNGEAFPSDRTVLDLSHWNFNDRAESVRVDPGYEVILCSDANFHGVCGRTNTNRNNLNDIANGLQHSVSSFQVCEGACPPSAMVPVQAGPVDTASFLPGSDVVFNWVGNGDEYVIEYWGGDLVGTHNSGTITGGATSWTKTGLPASANPYYWKINSWTKYGQTPWSSTYSFKVQDIAAKDVIISGPLKVISDTNQMLTAFINPVDAANLTLTWSPAPLSGQGTLSPVYNWNQVGEKTITLTATNTGGTMAGTYTVDVTCGDGYLAEYFNNNSLSGTPEFVKCEEEIDHDWANKGPLNDSDGDLTVAVNETKYTDDVRSKVTANADASQATVTVLDSTNFNVADEVLIIQMVGTGVGTYEFKTIGSKDGNVITLTSNLANNYSTTGGNKVQLLRVPHYKDVTVFGKLTAHTWDTATGGIVAFRFAGVADIKTGGSIDALGIGYPGGGGGRYSGHYPDTGDTGGSYANDVPIHGNSGGDCGGCISPVGASNGGAGTGGLGARGGDSASGGAGGSYGTLGVAGQAANVWPWEAGGLVGNTYGNASLSQLFFGSGGGGGGKGKDGGGAAGGNGGGIIWISGDQLIVNGTINANGTNAFSNATENGGGGGGAAGGSVLVNARTITTATNALLANGGAGSQGVVSGHGTNGGAGGLGRMHATYCESLTGTLSAYITPTQVNCDRDNFSVRWTGDVNFETAGTYKFTTWTDDGTKVWVDDELIVDRWVGQDGQTPYFGSKALTAGEHEVKMEYYEGTGGAKAKLLIEQTSSNTTPTVTQIPGQTITGGQSFSTTNLGTYGSDPDSGDSITWSYSGNTNISVAIASNVVTLTYPTNWTGTENITFTATDTHAAFATSTAAFQVNATACSGQFSAQYFNNTDLSGSPVLTRCENFIDNYWWDGQSPHSSVNANNFSARWEGTMNFAAGSHTFLTSSDNGIKVWLDNTLVIDNWTSHSWQNNDYTVTLTAGSHHIKVEYYEVTGDAVASLTWLQYGGNCTTVPTDLYCVEFFNNSTLTGSPVYVAFRKEVGYDWGGFGPGFGITSDDAFSLRWQGNLPFTAGVHEFATGSDDGVKVWVDSTLLIDSWGPHGYQEDYGSIILTAGNHLVKGEYREIGGGATVWESHVPSTNNAPEVSTIADQTINAGQSFATFDLDNYLFDWNKNDTHTWSYSGNGSLTVNIDSNKVATVTVPVGWSGEQNITFTATDSFSATGSETVLFKVNPCNFTAQYFNNTSLTGSPVLTRCEEAVSHFWWDGVSPHSSVNTNNFSARWEGTFNFDAGTYTFASDSDNGIKVWVDNVLQIDNWTSHSLTFNSASVTLTAGAHTVKVEYYDGTGDARASVSWLLSQTETSNCAVVNRFCAKFFNNTTLTGTPALSLLTKDAVYVWGTAAPGGGVNADNFSARWEGQFEFAAGTYTFLTGSDAGVRVWVDGTQVVNYWTAHTYGESSGNISLSAGLHTVKMEYYENTGSAIVGINWWKL